MLLGQLSLAGLGWVVLTWALLGWVGLGWVWAGAHVSLLQHLLADVRDQLSAARGRKFSPEPSEADHCARH